MSSFAMTFLKSNSLDDLQARSHQSPPTLPRQILHLGARLHGDPRAHNKRRLSSSLKALKTERCSDTNHVVTGDSVGCRYDNSWFPCSMYTLFSFPHFKTENKEIRLRGNDLVGFGIVNRTAAQIRTHAIVYYHNYFLCETYCTCIWK